MWNQDLVEEIIVASKAERWPYPKTFDALKKAGVKRYRTEVANHESTYFGDGGTYIEEVHPSENRLHVSERFNGEALRTALKHHQDNHTPYGDFLRDIAKAGVTYYEVDMDARRIQYTSGRDGESYIEDIPPFE